MTIGRARKMKAVQPGEPSSIRMKIVGRTLLASFGLLALRAVHIQISPPQASKLQSIAERQYNESIKLAPYRGSILDHRREPFAISIRLPSLYVNPRIFNPTKAEMQRLARMLRLSDDVFTDLSKKTGYFSWLKRRIPVNVSQQILAMELEGLASVSEPSRFYPGNSAAGQLLGFVGADDRGLMGLEKQFDYTLTGKQTELQAHTDARGRTIFSNPDDISPMRGGSNIILTIDRAIQEIAEEELYQGVRAAKAKGGSLIALDPHTGRILALASVPEFNPNDRVNPNSEASRSHVLVDSFEPGSVIKPFVIAKALDLGLTREDETHNCEKGYYRNGSIRIRDDHGKDKLTTAEVIAHSSNICTYKIAARLGREGLHKTLRGFGFGPQSSDLGFPGMVRGRIADPQLWSPARSATVSFGQGMTATALEVAQAYAVIANGGRLLKPYYVDRIESSDGIVEASFGTTVISQPLSANVARQIASILEGVVKFGTGKNAASAFYSTAGKTGTSEKVDPITRTYSKDKRVASFAGLSPVNDPRLVVYVVVDEPGEKPYYGATWAAPIFREFIDRSLRYLNVPPDVPKRDSAAAKMKLARKSPHESDIGAD